MNNLENKKIVIIASPGRTGTKFLADVLSQIIEDSFSVHEPDLFNFSFKDTVKKIKNFGFYNMILGRLLNKTGIRIISENYIAGKITEKEAIKLIYNSRYKYYSSIKENLIIESYYAWYGLIDLVPKIFPNVKVIGIVRDPRDWVRSNMNWGTQYGTRDTVTKYGFQRANPKLFDDGQNKNNWKEWTVFEKLCWEWQFIVSHLLKDSSYQSYTCFRYEDLFLSQNRENNFMKLVQSITNWDNHNFNFKFDEKLLNKKVHKNISYDFPRWEEWDQEKGNILYKHCNELMQKIGYGKEIAWEQLINE